MKISSFQGIPHAAYIKNDRNQLRTAMDLAKQPISRKAMDAAVAVEISDTAKALFTAAQIAKTESTK